MGRRGPGEGSIYQRKDGVWVGALDLGWEHGKRKRKFVHASTRRVVMTQLAEFKRRQRLGQRLDRDEQTVKEFLTRWLEWKKGHIRPRTLHGYQGYLKREVYPALGSKRLVELRVEHVQALLDKRTGKIAAQSVKSIRDILRNALNDAVRWGEVERNVAALARIPRQERMRVEALTSEQAATLLEQVKGDRLEALYLLTLATGLRRSEVLGLRWEDLDLEKRALHVRRGLHRSPGVGLELDEPKSQTSRRRVAIPRIAVQALESHRRRQASERLRAGSLWEDSGHVFTDNRGRWLCPDIVTHEFKEHAKACGMGQMTFHQLRHGAASLLIAQGVSLKIVQETLGHSTYQITADIYAHVAPELQQVAADAIDEALGGGS